VTVTDANRDALENQFGLADRVVDPDALARSVDRFRERGITLPTFAALADPSTTPPRSVMPIRKGPMHATSGAFTGTTTSRVGASTFPSTSCCIIS
jgi:hypothetical protein